jgi:hypothetical protein
MRSLRQGHHRYQRAAAGPSTAGVNTPLALTLRVATPDDVPRIARIAALDSSRPPKPPVLTAELDGEIYVAVSLADLATVADPFRLTKQVREITLARAQQLRGASSAQGRRVRRFGARHRTADPSPQPQGAT